jgi:hypothetical protein
MSWLLSPNILLLILIVAGGAGVSAYHFTKVADARHEGVVIGKSETAAAGVEEAKKAAKDWNAAQDETPLDADREYFMRLCATHASCALRSKYQAIYGNGGKK